MKLWLSRNRGFLVFLLLFGVFRTAVADWNPIPSGSMRPTLVEGDVVLVNRLAYDVKLPLTDIAVLAVSEPRRGDVVTFSSPADGTRLIKRLVGLPGDVVELRNDRLFLNGAPAAYSGPQDLIESIGGQPVPAIRMTERLGTSERTVQVLPSLPARRDFGPVTVPAGHYFFLGDNRDDSADSRYVGFVPRALLIGHAHHVLLSADILHRWTPRPERFGTSVR